MMSRPSWSSSGPSDLLNARNDISSDFQALREYVTAPDRTVAKSKELLEIQVTHSNLQQRHFHRFFKHQTLGELRSKIHQTTGTPPSEQHLQVMEGSRDHDLIIAELPPSVPETTKLGAFLSTGQCVHIVDRNPLSVSARGALENTNLVPKFSLTEEQYDARPDTLRSWISQQRAVDPQFTLEKYAAAQQQQKKRENVNSNSSSASASATTTSNNKDDDNESSSFGPETVAHCELGQRCQVMTGARRGRVAWVGQLLSSSTTKKKKAPPQGYWVGIVLDEPVGQNDGSVAGQRYFDAPSSKHGCIVRGTQVLVGPEYVEYDIFDDDSDSSSEDEL